MARSADMVPAPAGGPRPGPEHRRTPSAGPRTPVPAWLDGGPAPLEPRTFDALRGLLHARTGIFLAPHKLAMVQSRLNKRLRELGLASYGDYLARLEADAGGNEWTCFVNTLTTNLTRFFREEHHFHRLVEWLRRFPALPRPVRVWSAGCSTGEEPYSIAMVLRAAFPEAGIRILASDLDSAVLAQAMAGVYGLDRVDNLSPEWLRLAFLKGRGEQNGFVRIRPELGDLVTFRQLNLLQAQWPQPGSFEAVFCRNVMIYFNKSTQRELIERFHRTLVPGGLLMVGHSESLLDQALGFEPLGQTVFRRRD
jgi:chemotaxis protein methyltransferase CheR